MKKPGFYYRGVKKYIVFALIFLVLQEALGLVFPMLLKNVADLINEKGTTTEDIIGGGILVLCVVILLAVINLFSELFVAIATGNFQKKMRAEMFEKLQEAPTEKINEIGSGGILPLFLNDTSWVRGMQKQLIIFYVYFPIAILGSIIMLFVLEPLYALFALISLPLIVLFFYLNSKRIGKTMQKSIPAFDAMHEEVKEGITGAKEIRIHGKAAERGKSFARLAWFNRLQSVRTQQAINLSASFNAILFTITTIAIVIFGAYTMTDVSGLIVLNTALQYIKKLFDGSHYIFQLFVDYLPRVKIARKRIMKIYGLPVETHNSGKFSKPENENGIGLELVSVGYKHPDKTVELSSLNIKVEPGSRVTLTGGIGSGRTTIPQILLQNVKPTHGKVLIGGVDAGEINPTYYRRNVISFCNQEPEFIPGTVRDNLKLLNPEVTDEQILGCFYEIGAQDFVKKFKVKTQEQNDGLVPSTLGEDFLNFEIGERNNFNASTKKLLNLVRNLLKDAQVYIFNQCFDHINSVYIDKIMKKLRREKKTCLFISQNNSVSKHCDKIYVLKNGRISGEGKHSELIKNNADYIELYSSASGRIISEATI